MQDVNNERNCVENRGMLFFLCNFPFKPKAALKKIIKILKKVDLPKIILNDESAQVT